MPSRTTTRLVYLILLLSETERTETQYIDGKVCVVKRSFFGRAARARGGRGNASIPSEREEVSRGRGGEETHGSEATRDAGIYAIRAVVGTREKCANGVGEASEEERVMAMKNDQGECEKTTRSVDWPKRREGRRAKRRRGRKKWRRRKWRRLKGE